MALPTELSAKAQEALGLPPGFKAYTPFPFKGMNVQDSAIAIEDSEFTFIENFIALGNGSKRTAWDVGTPIYTVPVGKTIVSFFFYTIGSAYYCAVFLSDGSAVQVNTVTGVNTAIAGAGTFYRVSSGLVPACSQWGTQYLLISNSNTTNDYWIWDGTLLYTAGTVAPNGVTMTAPGAGYNSQPTITIVGGSGAGLQLTPIVQDGQVTGVTIQNPGHGFEVGDTVILEFSGGGSDTGAILAANLNSTSVAAINLTASGQNYTSATVSITGGGGSGATAVPIISGGVSSIAITAAGANYTSAPTVVITGGGGTGAAATAVLSAGVNTVNVTSGGGSYATPPTVVFTGGGGTGAAATAVLTGNVVTSVTVTNPGSGYSSPPAVSFTGGGGSGAAATATIIGGVGSVFMTNTGSGYTSTPTVAFSGGGGSGAAATATTSSGVSSVTVTNGGSGYHTATIGFVGGGGTGATAFAQISSGVIVGIVVTNGGSGYTSAPTVTITGDGVGATAVASVQTGIIVGITVTNGGSGYGSTPTVTISGTGTGALAAAILRSTSVASVTVLNGGNNYTLPPILTVSGGGGVGATATANLTGGVITSVTVSNGGSGYTSTPTVIIGGGANNAATAIVELMPFGISGTCLETFQQRVWIANPCPALFQTLPSGGNFAVSSAGSLTDFATSDGGVLFTNTDRFLQTQYVNIRQSNGYLYFFGDGSVSVVSNTQSSVNTSNNNVSTTFNYQNVDPQIGLSWRDSIQDYGRTVLFGNTTGVYALYGGAVTKVSGKLDQLFTDASFPPTGSAVVPTGAAATIFNIKHYLMLMTIFDPDLEINRNVMVTWNEKDWCLTSQTVDLTYIGTQKVSSKLNAFGTDGTSIYPLFDQPSASLIKRIDTKLYGADSMFVQKQLLAAYMMAQDKSGNGAGIIGTQSMVASGLADQMSELPSVPDVVSTMVIKQPDFKAPAPFFPLWGTGTNGQAFTTMGLRFQTQSPDFILGDWVLGYKQITAYF